MLLMRELVVEKINDFLAGRLEQEEIGWWAFDLMVESSLEFEPGYHTLLSDVLEALRLFHDTEPIMQQFYLEGDELLYYLRCLKGEELYRRNMVPHWKV